MNYTRCLSYSPHFVATITCCRHAPNPLDYFLSIKHFSHAVIVVSYASSSANQYEVRTSIRVSWNQNKYQVIIWGNHEVKERWRFDVIMGKKAQQLGSRYKCNSHWLRILTGHKTVKSSSTYHSWKKIRLDPGNQSHLLHKWSLHQHMCICSSRHRPIRTPGKAPAD